MVPLTSVLWGVFGVHNPAEVGKPEWVIQWDIGHLTKMYLVGKFWWKAGQSLLGEKWIELPQVSFRMTYHLKGNGHLPSSYRHKEVDKIRAIPKWSYWVRLKFSSRVTNSSTCTVKCRHGPIYIMFYDADKLLSWNVKHWFSSINFDT